MWLWSRSWCSSESEAQEIVVTYLPSWWLAGELWGMGCERRVLWMLLGTTQVFLLLPPRRCKGFYSFLTSLTWR